MRLRRPWIVRRREDWRARASAQSSAPCGEREVADDSMEVWHPRVDRGVEAVAPRPPAHMPVPVAAGLRAAAVELHTKCERRAARDVRREHYTTQLAWQSFCVAWECTRCSGNLAIYCGAWSHREQVRDSLFISTAHLHRKHAQGAGRELARGEDPKHVVAVDVTAVPRFRVV